MESVREEVATLQEWMGNKVTEDGDGAEALNECFTKKRTLKKYHLKPSVVSTITDNFQSTEAEILNKLRKVETNKSSTLCETGFAASKEPRKWHREALFYPSPSK